MGTRLSPNGPKERERVRVAGPESIIAPFLRHLNRFHSIAVIGQLWNGWEFRFTASPLFLPLPLFTDSYAEFCPRFRGALLNLGLSVTACNSSSRCGVVARRGPLAAGFMSWPPRPPR